MNNSNLSDAMNNISSSISSSLQQIWTRITDAVTADDAYSSNDSTFPSDGTLPPEIWLLGQCYPMGRSQTFKSDFEHLAWMTYRSGFIPPIQPRNYTSDVGWGCMIRSGQMILVNALLLHSLGRDWRLPDTAHSHVWKTYVTIMMWFLDVESTRCPFSVHRIVAFGQQELNIKVGSWFGPVSIAQTLKSLVNTQADFPIKIYVGMDGVVYKEEVMSWALQQDMETWNPLLVLIPLRLGVDNLNPLYYDAIKACFKCRFNVGIAGGRPNSSLYFVGYQGNQVLHMDPHHCRSAIPLKNIDEYRHEDFGSFHTSRIRTLNFSSMDPSLVLAFYIRDREEWQAWLTDMEKPGGPCHSKASPMFTLADRPMEWGGEEERFSFDSFDS